MKYWKKLMQRYAMFKRLISVAFIALLTCQSRKNQVFLKRFSVAPVSRARVHTARLQKLAHLNRIKP